MADTETKETLLEQIEELTDLEREDGETAEAYKERIARHFTATYPNTPEGNAAYDKIDGDITDWVDATSEAVRKNKSARKKSRLPELEGLEEDPAETKSTKRTGKAKGDGEKTGRKVGEKRELAATFEAAPEDAMVSKFLTKVLREHGYSKSKERSKAGHIVYKNGDEEIHVGPGKTEQAYMMGWRAPGQDKHSYGAASLADYLTKK